MKEDGFWNAVFYLLFNKQEQNHVIASQDHFLNQDMGVQMSDVKEEQMVHLLKAKNQDIISL